MIYALIATNFIWACLAALFLFRSLSFYSETVARNDAREVGHREHVERLENQIVLLKVEPQMAAIQAVPAEEASVSPYVSAFDDEALAEYEQERKRLAAETAEFVAQHELAVAE